jgi:hypothetical protein
LHDFFGEIRLIILGTFILPYTKAYYVSFDLVFNPNRHDVVNTRPSVSVVQSNGKWLAYKLNDNVPPWEDDYNE